MKTSYLILTILILFSSLASCLGSQEEVSTAEFVLTTGFEGGNLAFLGVSDKINGVYNPTLAVDPGETITVTLINGGYADHIFSIPDLNLETKVVSKKGEATSITFTVPDESVELEYYDSIQNHAALGMKGVITIGPARQIVSSDEPGQTESSDAVQIDVSFQQGMDPAAIMQKVGCGACHIIPGVAGAIGNIGPNLSDMAQMAAEHLEASDYTGSATTAKDYIYESLTEPSAFVSAHCPSGPCQDGLMPSYSGTLSMEEIEAIVNYFADTPAGEYAMAMDNNSEGATAISAGPADADAVDIVRDPTDLPGPIGEREPETIRLELVTSEVSGQLADGTTYTFWTFDNKVPGPFIRVRVGDTVELTLKNLPSSMMSHSIDLHAVTGPGGGAVATQTKPGGETMFSFKAINPGLYVYHCATPMVAQHIANGMYGLILVEPEGGLPPVDREFYVMQGELYTAQPFGTAGALTEDTTKLLAENPEYFVFNGAALALAGDAHALRANVGETVRIYFGVGGPNFTSSFHVIGEIFDRVYDQASLTSSPLTDVQTTLVPPGGATMVEFSLQVPGRYILVDHALSRLQRGLAGYLYAEGEPNLEIFNGESSGGE
ncbi:MAG TPA: copper-containing nitrite reductase [Anaerolineales bacterium]|nr:copper-containing nitrite reductase [Anaerolineales bacterium]